MARRDLLRRIRQQLPDLQRRPLDLRDLPRQGLGQVELSSQFPGLGAHHVAGTMDFDGDGDIDVVAGRAVLFKTARAGVRECLGAPNSTGLQAVLGVEGSASIQRGDLLLSTRKVPPGQAALTLFGPDRVAIPLGNGTRCVGGALIRMPIQMADASGRIAVPFDLGAGPGASVSAGMLLHLQTWYRDPGVGQQSSLSSSACVLITP